MSRVPRLALAACVVLLGCTDDNLGDGGGPSEAGVDASPRDASGGGPGGSGGQPQPDASRDSEAGDGGTAPECDTPSASLQAGEEACKECLAKCGTGCRDLCILPLAQYRSPGRKVPGPCFIDHCDQVMLVPERTKGNLFEPVVEVFCDMRSNRYPRTYVHYNETGWVSRSVGGGGDAVCETVEQLSGIGDYAPWGFERDAEGRLRTDCDGPIRDYCCEAPDGGSICDDSDAGWEGCIVYCNDQGELAQVTTSLDESLSISVEYDAFGNIMAVDSDAYNYDCWCQE